MVEGVNKKIVYDFEGSTFEMRPKNFTELEEIVEEDINLKSGTYTVQFVRNGMTIQIKSQRQFESFIIDEPNESGVHKITITRADDKPKPVTQEEPKVTQPSTDMLKPKPVIQEEPKVAKPSTDRKAIPYDQMTTHISDKVNPYSQAIELK